MSTTESKHKYFMIFCFGSVCEHLLCCDHNVNN